MRTLVVGDVHGCADELEALLDRVRADRVVLVGDLYTKGPDPVGVWRLIAERGLEAVLGNHDARLLAVLDGQRRRDTHAQQVVAALDAADRTWREHLRGLPWWLDDVSGWLVVHAGIHPTEGVDGTTRGMAVSMRRFPVRASDAPLWWESYTGDRPVAYGHDARRGLIVRRRDGEPHLVGLDSGCVYGGALSGWLIEERRLVSVPARAVYEAV